MENEKKCRSFKVEFLDPWEVASLPLPYPATIKLGKKLSKKEKKPLDNLRDQTPAKRGPGGLLDADGQPLYSLPAFKTPVRKPEEPSPTRLTVVVNWLRYCFRRVKGKPD